MLLGTSILNIGVLLQKSEVTQLPTISLINLKVTVLSFLKCKKWILGTSLTSLGWLMYFLALTLAPVSIITPLNNSGVIILAIIAVKYFHERLSNIEWFGFVIILLGILTISITVIDTTTALVPEMDLNLLFLFLVLLGFVTLIIGVIVKIRVPLYFPHYLGISSGIYGGLGAICTKIISLFLDDFLIIVLCLLGLLVFQSLSFVFLQAAFQKEKAMIIVPLFNSFSTLIPVILGITFFGEFLSLIQIFGIVMILFGSSLLFNLADVQFIQTKSDN